MIDIDPNLLQIGGSVRAVSRGSATLGDQLAICGHPGQRVSWTGAPHGAFERSALHASRVGQRRSFTGAWTAFAVLVALCQSLSRNPAASKPGRLVFQLGHLRRPIRCQVANGCLQYLGQAAYAAGLLRQPRPARLLNAGQSPREGGPATNDHPHHHDHGHNPDQPSS
jgi:hypothetical protein